MQKAPVLKGSGLKPLDEKETSDEVVHIFGKNLEERVLTKDEEDTETISFVNEQDKAKRDDDDVESLKEKKFDTITGEEDEETVFQGEFKLFTWDLSTSNWIEKGRGQLKLNDCLDTHIKKSRLIMRVGGTLKIVLNVAIRSSFKILANTRSSIRFTDSQTVWAATGSNAQQLRDLIDERLEHVAENSVDSKKRSMSDNDVPSKKTKSGSVDAPDDDTSKPVTPSKENESESPKKDSEDNEKTIPEGQEPVNDNPPDTKNEDDTEEGGKSPTRSESAERI